MSLLANSNAIESGGYPIQRSLRFRSSASAYLNRTFTTPTNNKIWTFNTWLKRGQLSTFQHIFDSSAASGQEDYIRFTNGDILQFSIAAQATSLLNTSQVFRDPSAFYMMTLAVDTTQATASNRVKLYINGTQVTAFSTANYPAQNAATYINSAAVHNIGCYGGGGGARSYFYDGYLTETVFIDGQALTPSSFGQTDAVTGVWTPKKYTGTYGTNGFYLPFSDNTSATTLAYDKSGNGNNWTPNNISTTAGATYDSMTDVPTLTSATAANYCTWNPLTKWRGTLSDGNLTMSGTAGNTTGTMSLPSGKWYFECKVLGGNNEHNLGFATSTVGAASSPGAAVRGSGSYVIYTFDGKFYDSGTASAALTTFAANDIIMLAYDADNSKIYVGKNGTWLNSAVPSSGTGAVSTTATAPLNAIYQFDSGNATGCNTNFGQQPFSYTPPTGFVALNTFNLPDPTIKKPNQYMDATLYSGTSASQSVTNAGAFQPDLVWVKSRSAATDHKLTDSVRGTTKALISDTTGAETTDTNGLTAFNSNGFTVGSDSVYNNGTGPATYVGWQWKKGATPGFDIVTYTGNGASTQTVNHSLGVAPKMIIGKNRGRAADWPVYHASLAANNNLFLDLTNAAAASPSFGWIGSASSTTITLNMGATNGYQSNQLNDTFVAYLFAEIAGFSKFGSYDGNNSTDGPFVYCGFRPRWILIKKYAGGTSADWHLHDTTRDTYNSSNSILIPDSSGAEAVNAAFAIDVLSNGFKLRTADASTNGPAYNHIFAAFAENPFKYSLAR